MRDVVLQVTFRADLGFVLEFMFSQIPDVQRTGTIQDVIVSIYFHILLAAGGEESKAPLTLTSLGSLKKTAEGRRHGSTVSNPSTQRRSANAYHRSPSLLNRH